MVSNNEVDNVRLWVALPGFKPRTLDKPEKAGVHYEARRVREKLTLGLDCSDVLSASWPKICRTYSQTGLCFSRNNSDAAFQCPDQSDGDEDDDTSSPSSGDEAEFDNEDRAYEKYLKSLDPTKFKEQDHYKVLGLSKLRWKASVKQIKLAYKKKVLNHHPDKRRQKGQVVKSTEEDYFTCISKAYEFLSHKQKRRAFDSVDPLFDEEIPSGTLTYKENFFKLYGPAFERNERWSVVQPVPKLGDNNSSEDHVNKFYNFWYNLDSWREFSYLDEEDKEKGENRMERRWIDKQNKSSRDKRRKDELKRLRTLVDSAYKNDPRVLKYKEDEKRRKEEERSAREEERKIKQEALEKERRDAEEKVALEKFRLDEEVKLKLLNEKKEKEQQKKALQKERKALTELCQKYNYFCEPSDDSTILCLAGEVDKICQIFTIDQLRSINDRLKNQLDNNAGTAPNSVDNTAKCRLIIDEFVQQLQETIENERRQQLQNFTSAGQQQSRDDQSSLSNAIWSGEENQLLVKAMTIFPVGTKSRWDVIAAFINEHLKGNENAHSAGVKKKTGKDVVIKVKESQRIDEKSKEAISKGVPLLQVKSNVQVETAPSVRTDSAQIGWESNPWTAQEQKLLEQALKTYSASDAERWDKVALCLPGRSKKDCVKRYKELAEIVRARKMALQQTQQQTKQKSSS